MGSEGPATGQSSRESGRASLRLPTKVFTIVALAVAVGMAVAISPFASSSPDGLEKVAEQKGFLGQGKAHRIQDESPIPDYAFPGIGNARVATGMAGFVGALGVFAVTYGLAALLRRRCRARGEPPGSSTTAAA